MSTDHIHEIELAALDYLRTALGERAPRTVELLSEFNEAPLEGEGRALLFAFDLPSSNAAAPHADCKKNDPRHYVVAGETRPNYFPSFGFNADDGYSFHIGTRFMLEMPVSRVDDALEPPHARSAMRAIVANYAPPSVPIGDSLAALFACGDECYAVYRVQIGDTDVYCMGADCPPGFYHLTMHPPQTALRLHLGKLIRAEARAADPSDEDETPNRSAAR